MGDRATRGVGGRRPTASTTDLLLEALLPRNSRRRLPLFWTGAVTSSRITPGT